MANTIFEEMGGSYIRQGGYFIPCLTLPTEKENKPISVWGQRHKRYLKQNHRVLYMNLLTDGKLNSYFADIDEQAESLFSWLIKQMVEHESVTEKIKAENQMKWVRSMNSIRDRATEIVNGELIFV